MLKHLIPFMDADGAVTGAGTAQEAAETESHTNVNAAEESAQEGADELKTGMDVKSEAQQLADGIVRKRLKGLSKDEIEIFREHKDEFVRFMESRKTESERIADLQNKAAQALTTAEQKEARANAMIAAASNGLMPEHIEDAVILAMARVNDETTIEDAIAQVAQNNPSWRAGARLPDKGSNPAVGADQGITEIPRYF